MLAFERWRPNAVKVPADTWPRIAEPGRWFHDMKNLTTELFRADAQWWSKASAFAALLGIAGWILFLATCFR